MLSLQQFCSSTAPLVFATPGHLEELAFQSFGLSSKDETQIGRFGTGLKYAIAIILRLGGKISIKAPGRSTLVFTSREEEFRGKPVHFVYANEMRLPFTTDLGKDWLPWMAYRELLSNTIDEGGEVLFGNVQEDDARTHIEVQCREIYAAYFESDKYFIPAEDTPLEVAEGMEVYAGASSAIFYKGIRIYEAPFELSFRYNLTAPVTLSEDRTAANSTVLLYQIGNHILELENEEILTKALHRKAGESNLSYSEYFSPSAAFMGVTRKLGNEASGNALLVTARAELKNLEGATVYSTAEEAKKNQAVNRGLALLRLAGADLSSISVAVMDNKALSGSYEVRIDKTIILNQKYIEDQSLIAEALFAAYCDIHGRNWLIREMIRRTRTEIKN